MTETNKRSWSGAAQKGSLPCPQRKARAEQPLRRTQEGEQDGRAGGAAVADGCRRQERAEDGEEGDGEAGQRLRVGGRAARGGPAAPAQLVAVGTSICG